MESLKRNKVTDELSFEDALKKAFSQNDRHSNKASKYSENGKNGVKLYSVHRHKNNESTLANVAESKYDQNKNWSKNSRKYENINYPYSDCSSINFPTHNTSIGRRGIPSKKIEDVQRLGSPGVLSVHHYKDKQSNFETSRQITKDHTLGIGVSTSYGCLLNIGKVGTLPTQDACQPWEESIARYSSNNEKSHKYYSQAKYPEQVRNSPVPSSKLIHLQRKQTSIQDTKMTWEQSIINQKPRTSSTNKIIESALDTLQSWKKSGLNNSPVMNNQIEVKSYAVDYSHLKRSEKLQISNNMIANQPTENMTSIKQNFLPLRMAERPNLHTSVQETPSKKFIRYKGIDFKVIQPSANKQKGVFKYQPNTSVLTQPGNGIGNKVERNTNKIFINEDRSLACKKTNQHSEKISQYLTSYDISKHSPKVPTDVIEDKDPLKIKDDSLVALNQKKDLKSIKIKLIAPMLEKQPKRKYKGKINCTGFPKPLKIIKKRENRNTDPAATEKIDILKQFNNTVGTDLELNPYKKASCDLPCNIPTNIRSEIQLTAFDKVKKKQKRKINKTGFPRPPKKSKAISYQARYCKDKIDTNKATGNKLSPRSIVASKYYELNPLNASKCLKRVHVKLKRLDRIDDFINANKKGKSRCRVCHLAGQKRKIREHVASTHGIFFSNSSHTRLKRNVVEDPDEGYKEIAKLVYVRLYKEDVEKLVIKPLVSTIASESVNKAVQREHVKKTIIKPIARHLINRSFGLMLRKERRREKFTRFVVKPTISRIVNEALKRIRIKDQLQCLTKKQDNENKETAQNSTNVRIKIIVSVQCVECKKNCVDTKQLKQHIKQDHNQDLQRHISNKEREIKSGRLSDLMQYYCFRE